MIESSKDPRKNLTVNIIRGHVSVDEVVESLVDFYRGKPTLNAIWDVTAAEADQFSRREVDRVIGTIKRHQHSRSGGRTAIVASRDVEFGLSRMFELMSAFESLDFEIAIFRTMEEARAWIETAPESESS